MTKRELIESLANYTDDTRVFVNVGIEDKIVKSIVPDVIALDTNEKEAEKIVVINLD